MMKVLITLLQISLLTSIALCTSWQSPSGSQRSSPVAAGDVAPDFTLGDQNGNKVTLSDARGKSPVILVFYRGYW